MLIYILENGKCRRELSDEESLTVPVLGRLCMFVSSMDTVSVRLHHTLHCDDDLSFGTAGSLYITDGHMGALCVILLHHRGYDMYERLCAPDQIHISNEPEADVCIPYMDDGSAICIDLTRNRCSVQGSVCATLNGNLLLDDCILEGMNRIECMGMVLIIDHGIILINTMVPHSNAFSPAAVHPEKPVFLSEDTVPLHYVIDPPVKLQAEAEYSAFHIPAESRSVPYLISGASMIMMASASVCAAVLNAYRGYEAGREWIDLMPQMILPGVMMISALILQPLQRFMQNRICKKELRIRQDAYMDSLQEKTDELIAEREHKAEACEHVIQLLRLKENVRHCDSVLLHIGQSGSLYHFETRIAQNEERDERTEECMRSQMKRLEEEFLFPWRIDLNQYRNILIVADEGEWIMGMLEEFLHAHSPRELFVCMTGPKEMFKNEIRLAENDHIFMDNGCRAFVYDEAGADMVRAYAQSCKRKSVAVHFANDFLTDDEHFMHIFIQPEEDGLSHDLVCNVLTHKAYDYLRNEECTFIPSQIMPSALARIERNEAAADIQKTVGFMDLFSLEGAGRLDIPERWRAADPSVSLKVPVGVDEHGQIILLDMHESADGPHGLVAGTTGSGKSEWLLSLIMSLAVCYAPSQAAFVLIDFKGGSLIQPLMNTEYPLPHIAGVLSNLESNSLQRVRIALANECTYRQRLFVHASSENIPVTDIRTYRAACRKQKHLPALADLVIIVDEFAQLRAQFPEFLHELISIARIGRSLGIHLILATQKPGGIVTDQIWSNARFKVCLKTAEKQDSMEMIGCPDACALNVPGSFILLKDGMMRRGQSGYLQAAAGSCLDQTILHDPMLRVVNRISGGHTEKTQISHVLQQIHAAAENESKTRCLWMNEIETLHMRDMPDGAIGLIDDIYHSSQPPLKLSRGVHLVMTPDENEKRHWLSSLMYVLMADRISGHTILISHDAALAKEPWFVLIRPLIEIMSEEPEKRSRQLQKSRYIIFTDTAAFHQTGNSQERLAFLQDAQKNGASVFLHISSPSDVSYREHAAMQNRICLCGCSQSDISSLIESRERIVLTKKGHEILMHKHLLEFCYALTELDDWEKAYG